MMEFVESFVRPDEPTFIGCGSLSHSPPSSVLATLNSTPSSLNSSCSSPTFSSDKTPQERKQKPQWPVPKWLRTVSKKGPRDARRNQLLRICRMKRTELNLTATNSSLVHPSFNLAVSNTITVFNAFFPRDKLCIDDEETRKIVAIRINRGCIEDRRPKKLQPDQPKTSSVDQNMVSDGSNLSAPENNVAEPAPTNDYQAQYWDNLFNVNDFVMVSDRNNNTAQFLGNITSVAPEENGQFLSDKVAVSVVFPLPGLPANMNQIMHHIVPVANVTKLGMSISNLYLQFELWKKHTDEEQAMTNLDNICAVCHKDWETTKKQGWIKCTVCSRWQHEGGACAVGCEFTDTYFYCESCNQASESDIDLEM